MSDFLVDTNVLVYAHDPRDMRKRDAAVRVLQHLTDRGLAVLSVQCLTEFYRIVRWRLPEPLTPAAALGQVAYFSTACRVVDLTPATVVAGCWASGSYNVSIWDALIWAAAKLNEVPSILTEDTSGREELEGVRYYNPFADNFDLASLTA